MKKILLALMCFIMSITIINSVHAAKEKYIDKNFNFSNIKTVLLFTPQYPNNISDIKAREINEVFLNTAKKLEQQGIRVVDFQYITNNILRDANITQEQLNNFAQQEPQKFQLLCQMAMQQYVDAAITMNMLYVDKYTVHQQAQTVRNVFTGQRLYDMPASSRDVTKFGVRFDVYSPANPNQPVMSIIDESGSVKKVMDRFFDDFDKLRKK